VDTICGSVVNVWKRVERYAQEGYTSVIHGKYYHEETQATSSRVTMFRGGQYLVVLSDQDAQYVCDYIVKGGNKAEFLKRFENAVSPEFNPDLHLARIGVANQTTMLSSESLHIASMLRQALAKRYGEAALGARYMAFDTICSATQERQDAIVAMKEKKPDLILVIGGYNSSNTTHLQEIAMKYAPSYHINSSACLIDRKTLRHQPFGSKTELLTQHWLPDGPSAIGITAGASTPNRVMGEVLDAILKFQN
jgi:4-hydroxy-3-methylbut-2-enyl diphosphate reductase